MNIFILGTFILSYTEITKERCFTIGIFCIYCYFLSFNYAICLSFEVILKIKKPMDMRYSKRSKIYHIFSHYLAFFTSLLIGLQRESGQSSNYICMIKRSSPYVYLIIFPIILFIPTLILTIYITCRMSKRNSFINYFLIKHSLYVTTYFLI